MQAREPSVVSVVYSGDPGVTKEDIIKKVKVRTPLRHTYHFRSSDCSLQAQFDIDLNPRTLAFVFLTRRRWVEDHTWKRFTLLGQSIGSLWLGLEAASALLPDLYIGTFIHATSCLSKLMMGRYDGLRLYIPPLYAPRHPSRRIRALSDYKYGDDFARLPSTCRTHQRVEHFKLVDPQPGKVAVRVRLIIHCRLTEALQRRYYRLFMAFYAFSLRRASFLMVNSSWTKGHIDWIVNGPEPKDRDSSPAKTTSKGRKQVSIVYPSCDTTAMKNFPLEGRERVVLSVAQFRFVSLPFPSPHSSLTRHRPEKDHATQLKSFHALLTKYPQYAASGEKPTKLVLVGGCRNEGDRQRVESLRELAKELGIEVRWSFLWEDGDRHCFRHPDIHISQDQTTFVLNASYEEMLGWLRRASVGLSTMIDEHFGINVVEFMVSNGFFRFRLTGAHVFCSARVLPCIPLSSPVYLHFSCIHPSSSPALFHSPLKSTTNRSLLPPGSRRSSPRPRLRRSPPRYRRAVRRETDRVPCPDCRRVRGPNAQDPQHDGYKGGRGCAREGEEACGGEVWRGGVLQGVGGGLCFVEGMYGFDNFHLCNL